MTRVVVGIDAGGTATRALLVNEAGTGRASATGRGANANSSADVDGALHGVLAQLVERGTHIDVLVLGVAGAGPAGQPRAEALLRAAAARTGVDIERLLVVSDIETAFAAASADPDGTVLIAGTGAIAAQVTGFRVARRADGHGYLLGDHGSGFWIGMAAVRAALADFEGRGPSTALRARVVAHARAALGDRVDAADLDDVQAVLAAVYGAAPASLGSFAPLLEVAATTGDAVASRIIDAAIAELVTTARLAGRDGAPDAPLVVTGSVATGDGVLGRGVRAALERAFGVQPRIVRDASLGAAALALRALPDADGTVADRLIQLP